MKRFLKIGGQALGVIAITLALDFVLTSTVFSDYKRAWAEAEEPSSL